MDGRRQAAEGRAASGHGGPGAGCALAGVRGEGGPDGHGRQRPVGEPTPSIQRRRTSRAPAPWRESACDSGRRPRGARPERSWRVRMPNLSRLSLQRRPTLPPRPVQVACDLRHILRIHPSAGGSCRRAGRPLLDHQCDPPGLHRVRALRQRPSSPSPTAGASDRGRAHRGHRRHPAAAVRDLRDDPGGAGAAGRRHPPDRHRDRTGPPPTLVGDGVPDRAGLRRADR